jgi:hypothetical protein
VAASSDMLRPAGGSATGDPAGLTAANAVLELLVWAIFPSYIRQILPVPLISRTTVLRFRFTGPWTRPSSAVTALTLGGTRRGLDVGGGLRRSALRWAYVGVRVVEVAAVTGSNPRW